MSHHVLDAEHVDVSLHQLLGKVDVVVQIVLVVLVSEAAGDVARVADRRFDNTASIAHSIDTYHQPGEHFRETSGTHKGAAAGLVPSSMLGK